MYHCITENSGSREYERKKQRMEVYRDTILCDLRTWNSVVLVNLFKLGWYAQRRQIQFDLLWGILWKERELWMQELIDFFSGASIEQISDFEVALSSSDSRNYEKSILYKVAEVLWAYRLGSRTYDVKKSTERVLGNS